MKRTTSRWLLANACAALTLLRAFAGDEEPSMRFKESFSFPLGNFWCENHLSVADMDGDGRKDIALMATGLVDSNGPPWRFRCRAMLLRAEGGGAFAGSVIAEHTNYGYGAVTADLNRDGAQDLILRKSSPMHVLLNDGRGSFTEVWTGQPGHTSTAVGDFNRDGWPDFVSGTQTGSGGMIELFTNDGTGGGFQKTWQSRLYGAGYDSIETVLALDLNNDGRLDLLAREIYRGLLVTLLGTNGAVPFVEQSVVPLGDRTFALAAGRVNGDAFPDLAAHVGWGRVLVFTNRGDGTMSLHWQSEDMGDAAFNLALADFDRDGRDDVFVGTFGDGALRVYRNDGAGGFSLWWQDALPGQGYTGSVADLNDDGYPDLIVGERNRLRVWVNQIPIPRITSLAVGPAGATIQWTAVPAQTYRVLHCSGLDGTNWTALPGHMTARTTTAVMIDSAAGHDARRFYRVIKLP